MATEVAPWDSPAPAAAEVAPWDSPEPDGPGPITSLVNDTGRAAQLAYRGIVTGAAGIPQAALDAADSVNVLNPHSALSRAFTTGVLKQPDPGPNAPAPDASAPYKPQLSDFVHPDKWQQAAEFFADKAGLPKPETDADKVLYKGAQAAPYAITAPEALVPGAVSAAAGGAASEATRQAGGGPLAQTLAGLAAGGAPALASAGAQGARALIRNQADTAERIANAAASGTPLTAGQATGSPVLQYAEGASSKLWGGGPIKATAKTQTENLGNHVEDIVDNLSQGTTPSPTAAGEAINKGAATSVANMKAAEQAAYDKVDSLVAPSTPVSVSGTLAKLDQIAAPTPGAEATTGALVPPKIATLRENLAADAAKSGGQLPYGAVKQVRSAIGANIDHGFAPSDPAANGAYKAIYKSLSEDMGAGASAVSPEAQQAAKDAASLYAQNQTRRDFLNSVIDKAGGPEAVYAAATNGTKLGATKIGGVMSALDPGQQNLVRATVISRLGRALPSAQNAEGSAFNASTFLTNWSKLDPVAKDALFGASGAPKSLRASLDSLAETMSNIREGTKLQNFSGTGEAVGHTGGLIAAYEGIKHALTSPHPFAVGAGVAGGLAANNLLARALVNPRTVRWLASSAKLPTYALPNAVNQLAKLGKTDPDARDLAASLQGAP